MNLLRVPMPDAVAVLVGSQIPEQVLRAEFTAVDAAADAVRYRGESHREDREDALGRLAGANKTLAAYNPGLIVRRGGAL